MLKLSESIKIAERHLSSSPKKHIVINAVGVDRPGIVADVTRIVNSNGGNVGESRAQLLGGHFSLMMLVEIDENSLQDLQKQLGSNVEGLSTGCFDAIDPRLKEMKSQISCKYVFNDCFVSVSIQIMY